jgi:nicotinamide-nucleotide amidase
MSAAAAAPRWAEIIAVGTELLVPPRVDTNSLHITERLNDIGIQVRAKSVVGDSRADLELLIRQVLARTELLVLSGGLGPTDDDLTRDAVAAVTGRPMSEDAGVIEHIRARFALRGARMPEVNRRQALVPAGADVLPNPRGTAPGLWLEHDGRLIVLLPGPPNELKPMFDTVIEQRLGPLVGGDRLYRRTLRICGLTESEVEEVTFPVYGPWASEPQPIVTTILTAPGQVELHLALRSPSADEAQSRLEAAVAALAGALGSDLYSTDGRQLEDVVGDLLVAQGATVAVAESCTGGLLSSRLTDVSGSSAYVRFNAVCYSNEAKTRWLGVDEAALREHGAVSEPVALAMADGIRQAAGATIGVGVTGVAGPTGGTETKPVGMVVIAVTTELVRQVRVYRFPFTRVRNKQFAAQMALDLVRRVLLGADPGQAFVFVRAGAR